jgi:hypothetical protein
MIKRRFIFLIITIVSITLSATSCKVKKMTKQARQFEAAGMFKEATDTYYDVLMRKTQDAEMRIALRRTGQIYAEELSAEVRQAFNLGKHKDAVYHYMAIVELNNKLGRAGINLKTDPEIDQMYADSKDAFLNEQYTIGLRLISGQDYSEAKKIFGEISKIDPNFRDTRTYLSEATHEPVYIEGTQLFNEGKFMEAFYKWQSIVNNQPDYKDTRERMDQALDERYRQGILWLMNEDFDNAEAALGDVFRQNAAFKDVRSQYTIAKNEPIYRQANEMLKQDRCRSAYFDFDKIVADAGEYKDARSLRAQALECAQYPVAVYSVPISRNLAATNLFENNLLKNMLNTNNIFLKVFDLASVDSRIGSRIVGSSGTVDGKMLANLKSNHGIKALLLIEHSGFYKETGNLKKKELTGFERITTKDEDGNTKIYDRQVKYFEFEQRNSVKLKTSYKLISTESSQILLSNTYSGNRADEINYASYSGDKNILYPSLNKRGAFSIDESGYRRLQNLLRSRTNIQSADNLELSLFNELTGKIANDINNFNPER